VVDGVSAPRLGAGALLGIRSRPGRLLAGLLIHLPLLICAATMIFPFLWMLSTSLKHPGKQFVFPPQLIPSPIYVENYVELFELVPMQLFLFNTT
jgi:multiple sugar transport system permease protein